MAVETHEFIEFLLSCDVLKFGDFTTKSGRKTPYFINTGLFQYGGQIAQLCRFYAEALKHKFPDQIDNLYGPAYKGIPLVVGTAQILSEEFHQNVSFTFNRKEVKDHGEGGLLVGYQYEQKQAVYILEDVITAGTSLRETMELLKNYPNAEVKGLLVSVDRMEKVTDERSALQQARDEYGITVESIVSINDIMDFVSSEENIVKYNLPVDSLDRMKAYRDQYGAEV